MNPAARRTPAGLGTAGRALWSRLTADPAPGERIIFSAAELVTLEMAARSADLVADLEALLGADGLVVTGSKGQPKLSGAVAELRLQRAALARLVGQLAIPEDGEDEGMLPAQRKAQRAAQARWQRQARRRGSKHGAATAN